MTNKQPEYTQRPEPQQKLTEQGQIAEAFKRLVDAGVPDEKAWQEVEKQFSKEAVDAYRKLGI